MSAGDGHPQQVGWDGLTIGERLRGLRKERGLSQRAISEPGVTYAYISRVEAGTRDPSVKAIRMLAAKLDVDPHWLESGDGVAPVRVSDADAKKLIVDYNDVLVKTPHGRRLLKALRQRR